MKIFLCRPFFDTSMRTLNYKFKKKKNDNDDDAEGELLPLPEVDGGPSIQTPL